MPRVKIDYVVSFSSEDPEHPANNLLNREVSKKKWLCKKGESSCSVVLQLAKAVKISSVHIGVYNAALVEVLVGRSEMSSDQFQVLVARSVFLSREDSRRGLSERVRSFSGEQLAPAAAARWDRLRLVCQQPHHRHAQYGISFIHIDESEDATAAAVPPRLLALGTYSSDEEDFKPGELFAKHRQKLSDGDVQSNNASNTDAQIRQATSQALKNIPESSAKLMKTSINKQHSKRSSGASSERGADRSRDTLMYTDDDELPHAKIDHVVQRHKLERERESNRKSKHNKEDREKHRASSNNCKDDALEKAPKRDRSNSPSKPDISQNGSNETGDPEKGGHSSDVDLKKRRRSNSADGGSEPARDGVLSGCELVLSGYVHPRRALLARLARALGARVAPRWGPAATHLLCAFADTPKLRAVRAASAAAPAVTAAWLCASARAGARLQEAWFACEPPRRRAPPAGLPRGDSDDDVRRLLRQLQRAPNLPPTDSDGELTEEEDDTLPITVPFGGSLPDFFDGHTFTVVADRDAKEQMSRYIRAYGGLVLEAGGAGEAGEAGEAGGARELRGASGARWLGACLAARALLAAHSPR